jgi:hypothetical protein
MQNAKRKRAIVLALIAFFCTAAATYVAVDWKRVSGGLLARLNGRDGNYDKSIASSAAAMSAGGGVAVAKAPAVDFMPQDAQANQQEVALATTRRHLAGVGGGFGSFKSRSDDDLFKYGDPAAGIPAGKFIVAQNDPTSGPAERAPDLSGGIAAPGITGPRTEVTSAAPAPTGNGGPAGDGLLRTSGTPADTPSPSDPGGGTPSAPAPATAVPEASSLAMMSLGALFLAVAAARRRQQA